MPQRGEKDLQVPLVLVASLQGLLCFKGRAGGQSDTWNRTGQVAPRVTSVVTLCVTKASSSFDVFDNAFKMVSDPFRRSTSPRYNTRLTSADTVGSER